MRRPIMILVGLLGLLGTAVNGVAGSVCGHVNIEWISTHLPFPTDTRIVLKQEEGQLCEVILSIGGDLAPVYAGNNFILVGQLFKEGRSITRETINTLSGAAETEHQKFAEEIDLKKEKRSVFFKKNIKALEEFVSLSLKPSNAKDFLYVITDPDCSHCKDLLPKLELTALESGIELKVIIYPILGVKSRNMAIQAICNKFPYQAYKEIQMTESTYPCEQAEKLLKKTDVFFQSAGLSFVPLVIAGDGSWVVEVNDIHQVRSHLGIESSKVEAGPGGACSSN